MNEEIEYAEMLEIPVSTVNVVRKNRRRKKTVETPPTAPSATDAVALKDSVIAQVNDRLDASEELPLPENAETLPQTGEMEGRIDFDPIPERIDTVRLYSTQRKRGIFGENLYPQEYNLEENPQNDPTMYKTNERRASKLLRVVLGAEFAAACVLCGAIFLTNIFVQNSAINTFFRSLNSPSAEVSATDTRSYSDFTLSPVVSELTDAELSLSPAGVLSFTEECCVYPSADGIVSEVTQTNGLYTVKIRYSDTFTGVINGLDYAYYAVGDEVKANVPVGFSKGESEVQVTMYSAGELLNCFQLTEENCLAWIAED